MGMLKGNDPERAKRAYLAAQRELEEDERQKNIYKQAILEARREEQRESSRKRNFRIFILLGTAFACLLLCIGIAMRYTPGSAAPQSLTGPQRTATAIRRATTIARTATAKALTAQDQMLATIDASYYEAMTSRAQFSGLIDSDQTSPAQPAPPGSKVVIGPYQLEITEARRNAQIFASEPNRRATYILMRIDCKPFAGYENTQCLINGSEQFSLFGSTQTLYSPYASSSGDNLAQELVIRQGDKMSGWLAFENPSAETGLILAFQIAPDGGVAYLTVP